MQERSEAERRAIMAMPQCCYLAKGAKRPSHTTNTIKFDRIPFDPSNSIKRFDLCPFDQKNSTCLQPPADYNYNVEETKDVNDNVDPTIKEVFEKIEQNTVMIESAYRHGKKSESNTRPRPIEVKLSTEFDKRKVMANARLLKGSNLFVKPKRVGGSRSKERDRKSGLVLRST